MGKLKKALYLVEQVRLVERQAQDELAISEDELMRRAGLAAFKSLKSNYPDIRHIIVFCGSGNNAGDAFVVAKLAQQQGFVVQLFHCKPIEDLPPAASRAAYSAMEAGVVCQPIEEIVDMEGELIVDGLLGIGIQGDVYGAIAQTINLINDSDLPVISLDVPSGLDADTGTILGACVRADITVSFIAQKVGMYTADASDYCGKIICNHLELESCLIHLKPAAYLLSEMVLEGVIAPRHKNSHKGDYGHVLVIGGDKGMVGATYLAAMASLRVGAGKTTIATHPEHGHYGCLPTFPEIMVHGIESASDLLPLLQGATVCVLGPGLGERPWAEGLYEAVIAAQLPLVMDASALRILARHPQHDDNWILTPHPGEAANLLSCSASMIQENRWQAVQAIQQRYGGAVVLKGAGTLIGSENEVYICADGNPGMASAGMGDILSGVIGGVLAQGVGLFSAAQLGVWLHAKAGDDAAHQGERGLVASDLLPYLRKQVNKWV